MSELGNVNFNNSNITSTNTENQYRKQENNQRQRKRQRQPKNNSGSLKDNAMANLMETISRNQREDDLLDRNQQRYIINRERNLQSSKDYLNHVRHVREEGAKLTQKENEAKQETNQEYKARLQELGKEQINKLLKKPINKKESGLNQNKTNENAQSKNAEGKQSLTAEGKQSIAAEGKQSLNAEGKQSLTAEGKQSLNAEGKQSLTAEGKQSLTAEGKQSLTAEGKQSLTAEGKLNQTTNIDAKINNPNLSTANAEETTQKQSSLNPTLDRVLNKVKGRLNLQNPLNQTGSHKLVPEFNSQDTRGTRTIAAQAQTSTHDATTIHPDLKEVQTSIHRAREWNGKQMIHRYTPLQANEIEQFLGKENLVADYKSVQMIKAASNELQRSDRFFMKAAAFLKSINFPLEKDIIYRILTAFETYEKYKRPVTLRKMETYLTLKMQEIANQEAKAITDSYLAEMQNMKPLKGSDSVVHKQTPMTANLNQNKGEKANNQPQTQVNQTAQNPQAINHKASQNLYKDVSVQSLNLKGSEQAAGAKQAAGVNVVSETKLPNVKVPEQASPKSDISTAKTPFSNQMSQNFEAQITQLLKDSGLNPSKMMLTQINHMARGDLASAKAIIHLLQNNMDLSPENINQVKPQFIDAEAEQQVEQLTTKTTPQESTKESTARNLPPTLLMNIYGDREQTRKTMQTVFNMLNNSSLTAKKGFIIVHQLLSLFDLTDQQKSRLSNIMKEAQPFLPKHFAQLTATLEPLLVTLLNQTDNIPMNLKQGLFQAISTHLESGTGLPGLKQIISAFRNQTPYSTNPSVQPDLSQFKQNVSTQPPTAQPTTTQTQQTSGQQAPTQAQQSGLQASNQMLKSSSIAPQQVADTPKNITQQGVDSRLTPKLSTVAATPSTPTNVSNQVPTPSNLTVESILQKFYPNSSELGKVLNQQSNSIKTAFVQLHQWMSESQFMPQLQQLLSKMKPEGLMERLMHLENTLPQLLKQGPASEKVTPLLTYLERGGSPKILEKALVNQTVQAKPIEISFDLNTLFKQAMNTQQLGVKEGIGSLQKAMQLLSNPETLFNALTQLAKSPPANLTQQMSQLTQILSPLLQHMTTTPGKQVDVQSQQQLSQHIMNFLSGKGSESAIAKMTQPIVEQPALNPAQYQQVHERLKQAGLNITDITLLKQVWHLAQGNMDKMDAIAILLHGNLPLEQSNIQIVTQYIQKLPPGKRFQSISKILSYLSNDLISLINHQLKNPQAQAGKLQGTQQHLMEQLFNQRGQQVTQKASTTSEQILKQFKGAVTEQTVDGMRYLLQNQMAKTASNLNRIQTISTNHLSPKQMFQPLQQTTQQMINQLNNLQVPPQQKAIVQAAVQLMQHVSNFLGNVQTLMSPTVQNMGSWAMNINGDLKKLDQSFQKEMKSFEKQLARSLGQGVAKNKGWISRVQGYVNSLAQWSQQLQGKQDLTGVQRQMGVQLANLRTELEGLSLFLHQDSETLLQEWNQMAAEQKAMKQSDFQQTLIPAFLADMDYPTEISIREEPDPDDKNGGEKRIVINLLIQTHTLGQLLLRFGLGKKGLRLRVGVEQAGIRDWMQPYMDQLQKKMENFPFKIESLQTYVVSSTDAHQNLIARQIQTRYRRGAIESL